MSKRINWKQREKELMTEIERLTKQVELLTSEVDRLKNTSIPECHETPRRVVESDIPSPAVKSDIPSPAVKVCSCKGKCATKRCGCVQRHTSCSKLCGCSSDTCQNKEKNDEEQNKENLENIEVVAHNVARRRGLFRTAEDQETKLQDLKNNIEERVLQQEKHNETSEDNFDPMKPKHQLARTPLKDKKIADFYTDSSSLLLTPDNIDIKQEKTIEEELQVPKELNQSEVDWEKYQAQLVPCNKCKRKFHPNRVEKHQECCKKV